MFLELCFPKSYKGDNDDQVSYLKEKYYVQITDYARTIFIINTLCRKKIFTKLF